MYMKILVTDILSATYGIGLKLYGRFFPIYLYLVWMAGSDIGMFIVVPEVWPLYRRLATFSSRLTTLSSDIGCSSMLSCPRCDRKYSVTYTLDRHMRYECGVEKQFCCAVCLKRFSRSDVLRAHQRKAGHLPVEAGWMGSLLAYNRKWFLMKLHVQLIAANGNKNFEGLHYCHVATKFVLKFYAAGNFPSFYW